MAVMLNQIYYIREVSFYLWMPLLTLFPFRLSVLMAVLLLQTATRWQHLSANPILQNRGPIMENSLISENYWSYKSWPTWRTFIL